MSFRGKLLGVLGGMGPLATVDFLVKFAKCRDFARDQDHPPLIVYSNPATPDRSAAITGVGPSPLPDLLEGIAFLERNGADAIVIPCNTAHFWLDDMRRAARVPILSILHAAAAAVASAPSSPRTIGVLGTEGMLKSGLYQNVLLESGYAVVVPRDEDLEHFVEPAIRAVKAGSFSLANTLAAKAASQVVADGAEAIVLGCTELPIAFDGAKLDQEWPVIDSSLALANLAHSWIHGDKASED